VGNIAFGFRLAADGQHLEPDPAEQAALDAARQLRTAGHSLRAVADALNQSGHRTRRGTPWRLESVIHDGVLELIPPYVQTELMGSGQAADPRAMPLKDYLAETIEIIKTQPNATEILVERVKPLRFAASNGQEKYDAFFQQFNEAMMAPH